MKKALIVALLALLIILVGCARNNQLVFQHPKPGLKKVIVIGQWHLDPFNPYDATEEEFMAIYEVQRNIQMWLIFLKLDYGYDFVGYEGATGELTKQDIEQKMSNLKDAMPDAETKLLMNISLFYASDHFEYYQDENVYTFGVEDDRLLRIAKYSLMVETVQTLSLLRDIGVIDKDVDFEKDNKKRIHKAIGNLVAKAESRGEEKVVLIYGYGDKEVILDRLKQLGIESEFIDSSQNLGFILESE